MLALLRRAGASLKLRITLSAGVALLLGIGATSAMLTVRAERDTLVAYRHRELTESVRTAAMLSQRVVALQRALQVVARQIDPALLADRARLASFIEDKPVLLELFTNVFLASSNGTVLQLSDARGTTHPAVTLADRSYFKRTLAEHRPVVSDPVPGKLSGEPIVVLTYPLVTSGQVYGVISGTLNLTSRNLLEDLVDGIDANDGVINVVTDAAGRVLAHPDHRLVMQPLTAEPRLAQAYAEWLRRGAAVEPAGLGLAQPDDVVSAAGVAGPDWIVWRSMPNAEVLGPLWAARRLTLVWACALVGALSLAMLAWLWWLLRPLARLQHRAARLFDADQDVTSGWPTAGGEIGQLTRVLRHVGAERAQLEAFNTAVLQKLGSVMKAAPVGIAFTRAQRFELVSAEFCRLFGREEHELLGQPTRMIYASAEAFEALGPTVGQAFSAGLAYLGEQKMVRADGSLFWGQLRGRPVDELEVGAGTIWTVSDITVQVESRSQLEWSATHDALTGLFNRKALDLRLARAFDAMPRSLPAAVVMIDLDHFKPINDQAGHAAGDAMLKLVADAILACVRASDMVVRQGGDEFVLLLERCTSEVAMRIADNVRGAIGLLRLPFEDRLLSVGASIGVAPLTGEFADVAAWMAAADAACYRAKAGGRDAVCLAEGSLPGIDTVLIADTADTVS